MRSRERGTSLIELMVAVCVTSVIVVGAFQIMTEGLQLFRTNKRAADAQAEVLQILSRVTLEAVNARPDLIKCYPNSSYPSALSGLVFASPLLPEGNVRVDVDTAEIYWQNLICYYYEPSGGSGYGKLFRAILPILPTGSETGPGSKDLSNLTTLLTGRTTDYFQAQSAIERRLLGSDMSGFIVKPYAGEVGGAGAGVLSHDSYSLEVEAGDKNNTSSTGYYVKVQSRVTPRG